MIACGAIAWSVRRIGRIAPRRLLAGETTLESVGKRPRQRVDTVLFCALLGIAFLLGLVAVRLGQEAQRGAFLTAGVLVLTAVMVLVRSDWPPDRDRSRRRRGPGNLFHWQSAHRAIRPPAPLTIGLVAAASFLIAAVSLSKSNPLPTGARSAQRKRRLHFGCPAISRSMPIGIRPMAGPIGIFRRDAALLSHRRRSPCE